MYLHHYCLILENAVEAGPGLLQIVAGCSLRSFDHLYRKILSYAKVNLFITLMTFFMTLMIDDTIFIVYIYI